MSSWEWDGTEDWDGDQWESYLSIPCGPEDLDAEQWDDLFSGPDGPAGRTRDRESAIRILLDAAARVGARSMWELRKAFDQYSQNPVRDAIAIVSDDYRTRQRLNHLLRHQWLAERQTTERRPDASRRTVEEFLRSGEGTMYAGRRNRPKR